MRPFSFSLRLSVILLTAVAASAAGQPADVDGPQSLADGITLGARYLAAATEANGRFVYRFDLDQQRPLPGYNELRHAGTLYAMAMAHQWKPDPDLHDAMLRATDYLRRQLIRPVVITADDAGRAPPGMLAVWSPHRDGVARRKGAPMQFEARLGGAGLALVALTHVERIAPGTVPIEDLRGLGRFILYMQKPTGAFYTKYIPAQGGRWDEWESLYYPGEAALGLVLLHELDQEPAWVQGASNAIAYLAHRRRNDKQVPADHWALLATARLLPVLDEAPHPPPRQLLIDHALQVCRTMTFTRPRDHTHAELVGCLTSDGRTTPTATRIEGLIAALSFLPVERTSERQQIRAAVDGAIAFLLRAQVVDGAYAGAMPAAAMKLPENHPAYTRTFNAGVREVRIDYVQHALSAFIQYDELRQAD